MQEDVSTYVTWLSMVGLEMRNPSMTHFPFHMDYQAANKGHVPDVIDSVARADTS